ncbi:hypothetical protein TI03_04380 [Achromatium sp. WMS1]|nr:hypothetical protein TI03_04380 [Achromatium sp. WMS1]
MATSPALLRRVADSLSLMLDNQSVTSKPIIRYFYPAVILRNILFFMIVITHGLCRLLPSAISPLRTTQYK